MCTTQCMHEIVFLTTLRHEVISCHPLCNCTMKGSSIPGCVLVRNTPWWEKHGIQDREGKVTLLLCHLCVTTGTSFHFLEWMVSPPGKQSSISMALTEGNIGDLFQPPLPGYRLSLRGSHTGKSLKNLIPAHHIHSQGQRHKRMLAHTLTCLCPAQSLHSSMVQDFLPREWATHSGLGLPKPTNLIKIISYRHAHGPIKCSQSLLRLSLG